MNFTGGKSRTPFEGLTLATFDKTQRPNQTYPIYIDEVSGQIINVGESLQDRIKSGTYVGTLEDFEYNFEEAPSGSVAIWPITSKGKQCVWRLAPNRLMTDWAKGYIKVTRNRRQDSKNLFSIQYLPEGVIKKVEKGELQINGREENSPTFNFGENKTVGNDIPTIWLEKEFHSVKGTTLIDEIFSKKVFNYPKPLLLVTEILRAISSEDAIILDSFAGSASTAHATLNLNAEDSGNRKFILIEMEGYAETITAERVKRVMNGYGDVEGTGGAFDYYTLGDHVFDEYGNLNENVGEEKIRQYVYYTETREPIGEPTAGKTKDNKYLMGRHNGTGYYFYYERDELTTLDADFLATVKTKADQYVIYADNCLLSKEFMMKKNIVFKKIPRDITRF